MLFWDGGTPGWYAAFSDIDNTGFSAFVGLAIMLLLFPIPGYVAKQIQGVQVARLKKTDARVQTVTESKY